MKAVVGVARGIIVLPSAPIAAGRPDQ